MLCGFDDSTSAAALNKSKLLTQANQFVLLTWKIFNSDSDDYGEVGAIDVFFEVRSHDQRKCVSVQHFLPNIR